MNNFLYVPNTTNISFIPSYRHREKKAFTGCWLAHAIYIYLYWIGFVQRKAKKKKTTFSLYFVVGNLSSALFTCSIFFSFPFSKENMRAISLGALHIEMELTSIGRKHPNRDIFLRVFWPFAYNNSTLNRCESVSSLFTFYFIVRCQNHWPFSPNLFSLVF